MKKWHLLLHPDPDKIDRFLSQREKLISLSKREGTSNIGSEQNDMGEDGSDGKGEYFIPYLFLKNISGHSMYGTTNSNAQKTYNPRTDDKALRGDMHSLIFIRAEEKVIDSIIGASWNKDMQVHLRPYWSPSRQRVEISDAEMQRFLNAIKVRDFQYTFGIPTESIGTGDKVYITNGPMEGQIGEVIEKRYDKEGIKLSIAFDMFNNQMHIAIPNFRAKDIRLVDDNSDKAPYYEPIVTLFEKRLTHLLWLRHGKNGSPEFNDEEKSQLRSIFSYADLTIENDDDAQARFTALMLICAYLMKDNKAVKEYTDKVNEYLKGITIPTTETECYLMTALFITNHDPQVRSAAKAYRQSHPDCSPTICQFQSIAKNIRCR